MQMPEQIDPRHTENPVDPLFLQRWSPRAFDGSEMDEKDLMTIFDAARWAPSASNLQPWRFVYARHGDADWERFLGILFPSNASWAARASVLIFVLSDRFSPEKEDEEPQVSHTHSFDAGAAWCILALQALKLGYHSHGMVGIDLERARRELNVPDRFRVEAAVAIGKKADKSILPEKLQAREMPNGRRPLEQFIFRGQFRD